MRSVKIAGEVRAALTGRDAFIDLCKAMVRTIENYPDSQPQAVEQAGFDFGGGAAAEAAGPIPGAPPSPTPLPSNTGARCSAVVFLDALCAAIRNTGVENFPSRLFLQAERGNGVSLIEIWKQCFGEELTSKKLAIELGDEILSGRLKWLKKGRKAEARGYFLDCQCFYA